MNAQDIVSIAGQSLALIFLFTVGIIWLIGANKDGKLTKDEIAPISIIGVFIFMMVTNAYRNTEFMVFDTTTVLLVLGSVIALAGIDIVKVTGILNGDKKKNSKDGQ